MDIMRMALSEGCRGDLHESAVIFQFLDRLRTTISHTGPETAHQLKYGILHTALIRHTALYAFRHQLLVVLLEIAVLRSLRHGAQRAHPPVYLELTSLIDLRAAGRLLTPSQQRTQHDYIGACGDGLGNIARILDSSICNDGYTIFCGHLGRGINYSALVPSAVATLPATS